MSQRTTETEKRTRILLSAAALLVAGFVVAGAATHWPQLMSLLVAQPASKEAGSARRDQVATRRNAPELPVEQPPSSPEVSDVLPGPLAPTPAPRVASRAPPPRAAARPRRIEPNRANTPAPGSTSGPRPTPVRTEARWTNYPSRAVQARYLPAGVPAGSVTARCRVGVDERLRGCVVTAESPPGYGLGVSAIRILEIEGRVAPARIGSTPIVDETVQVSLETPSVARPIARSTPTPDVITEVGWLSRPDPDRVERYFPRRAEQQEAGGRAQVRCTISITGRTQGCVVLTESPAGMGFGEAAVRLIEREAQFTARRVNGRAVGGGTIDVPVTFVRP